MARSPMCGEKCHFLPSSPPPDIENCAQAISPRPPRERLRKLPLAAPANCFFPYVPRLIEGSCPIPILGKLRDNVSDTSRENLALRPPRRKAIEPGQDESASQIQSLQVFAQAEERRTWNS